MRINVFICQTPFQSFVCSNLCRALFKDDFRNIFISSVASYPNYPGEVIEIKNTFFEKIQGTWKAKQLIKKLGSKAEEIFFFMPHIDGVLSNYIYHNTKLNTSNSFINLYYEGVVMLDSKRVERVYPRNLTKKRILSALILHRFRTHLDILPLYSSKIKNVYTPVIEKTDCPPEKLKLLTFPKQQFIVKKGRCLIVGLDEWFDIENLYKRLIHYVEEKRDSIDEVLFKPHYSDKRQVFQKLAKEYNFQYQLVEGKLCIEELIADNYPEYVISPYLSSALINLKLIYKDELKVICVTNDTATAFSGLESLDFARNCGVEIQIG